MHCRIVRIVPINVSVLNASEPHRVVNLLIRSCYFLPVKFRTRFPSADVPTSIDLP